MSLQGELRDFSALEILQLLGSQRKTGCLTLEGPRETLKLWLHEGRLVSSRTPAPIAEDALVRFEVLATQVALACTPPGMVPSPPTTIMIRRGSRSTATVSAPVSDPSPTAAINAPSPGAPIWRVSRASGGMITLKFIATPETTPITKTQRATIGVVRT